MRIRVKGQQARALQLATERLLRWLSGWRRRKARKTLPQEQPDQKVCICNTPVTNLIYIDFPPSLFMKKGQGQWIFRVFLDRLSVLQWGKKLALVSLISHKRSGQGLVLFSGIYFFLECESLLHDDSSKHNVGAAP